MAKCVHCHNAQGRHFCPALQGRLCAGCCRTHRLETIACPSDCVHLPNGAELAVQRKADFAALIQQLEAYADRHRDFCRDAAAVFTEGTGKVEAGEVRLLTAFELYGYAGPDGERLVDRFVREHGTQLEAAVQEALASLVAARFGLFAVQGLRRDEGMMLADLVLGDKFYVHEKLGTRHTVRGDLRLGWVMPRGSRWEFTGAICDVPRAHVDTVLDATLQAAVEAWNEQRGWSLGRRYGHLALHAHLALRHALAQSHHSIAFTIDGEPVVSGEARFEVHDVAAVRRQLSATPDFAEHGGHWVWLDRKGRTVLGMAPLHLGTLELDDGELRLRTNSRKRLQTGKRLLAKRLGALISHRHDRFHSLEQASAKPPMAAPPPHLQS